MTHITLQIHQIYAWVLLEWPNHYIVPFPGLLASEIG